MGEVLVGEDNDKMTQITKIGFTCPNCHQFSEVPAIEVQRPIIGSVSSEILRERAKPLVLEAVKTGALQAGEIGAYVQKMLPGWRWGTKGPIGWVITELVDEGTLIRQPRLVKTTGDKGHKYTHYVSEYRLP